MGETGTNSVPPYPLAMVVCDAIHRDPGTGKCSLLGTFSVIGSREFPSTHPKLCVYLSLTDGHGTVDVQLELIDVNEQRKPVATVQAEFEFTDPRMILEAALEFKNLNFHAPGEYRLKLFAGSEFLMERRITVIEVSNQKDISDENHA